MKSSYAMAVVGSDKIQIEAADTLPNPSQTYTILVQEERQGQVRSGNNFQAEGASFSAGKNQIPGMNIQRSHLGRKQEGRRSQLFCEHCKKVRHTMGNCYKFHGYPNKQGGRGRSFRGANSARGEQGDRTEARAPSPAYPVLPGLIQEQLLLFLTSLTGGAEQKEAAPEATASAVHTAGITYALNAIYSFSVLSNRVWILDCVASEHT